MHEYIRRVWEGGRDNFKINTFYFTLCNNTNLRNNSFSVKMSCKNYML
jgi:hypothetical protein